MQTYSRRRILRNGALVLLASGIRPIGSGAAPEDSKRSCRVGMVTDLHYADKDTRGSRHYRETLAKFEEAAERFGSSGVNFVVELGDFIDAADSVETEMRYLKKIQGEFSKIKSDKHYVIGNHCVDTLTKEEFLDQVEKEKSYYSFDRGSVHFVVLDSCFRADMVPYGRKNSRWTDANIPKEELEWLEADLRAAKEKQVIVFAHQRLDISGNYAVKNAEKVRQILQNSGNVSAVFQGHSHKNDHQLVEGIHYTTLAAMVEGTGEANNGYSLMDIYDDGRIVIEGFRKQSDYDWEEEK